ncbi:AAA family ATPase [Candidatus Woesearchaeota archaeon]|nr:AAA family ATPase [Candidatus Woesearchaeota archaeon]
MFLRKLKEKITESPRSKLLSVIVIVFLLILITEAFNISSLNFAELQVLLLNLLPTAILNKLPLFIKHYFLSLMIVIILLVFLIIFLYNISLIKSIFIKKHQNKNKLPSEIEHQREPILEVVNKTQHSKKKTEMNEWIKTGVEGLDDLFEKGIPRGTSVLVAGGPGSGKTILCLQIMNHASALKEKALYLSLEESEDKLKKHMHDFGMNPEKLEKEGLLKIKRIDPFEISRNVEALLAKAKGELKIDINEIGELIPENFEPEWIFVDSLTALQAAFKEEDDNYRIYIEQLFKYFEKIMVTSFLISESEQIPTKYSPSGVEEFLADAVIVLYNIRKGNLRENAIEVLKLRGGIHKKKIVAMRIEPKKGVVVYPRQDIIGGIGEN